ncbi:type IV toxin-antitoxin system AbiEi family antitoxin domain-containing protein [Sphingomonas pituitosa]|uniref:type IV toxin-antitoxin system AbiEi family antitoxin domain-containing protein n=1 Tax=Sphingomonas pituitosa TaxID=99597 RepID=UPI00082BF451|nr:type IV toxin-antitoxin system AbiEi family antitoxin domain-containing protein [Sphingomonas pituitosa]
MRVFRLNRLASRERLVIGLLRGADPVVAAGDLHALFGRLRTAGSARGFSPAPVSSTYATRQELCLLGALAGFQRANPDLAVTIKGDWQPIVQACARRLAKDGVQLGHATLARLAGLGETCDELSIAISPVINVVAQPVRSAYPPLTSTLQGKALEFVRERGNTTSRDLAGFGVSRQVVSIMFKRGLLVRVRIGVYQAAPETVRG